jgi:hypothetical protein
MEKEIFVGLSNIGWYDVSIQVTPNGRTVLILICEQKEKSDKLLHILHHNAFDLIVNEIKDGGNYVIELGFPDAEIGIKLETNKNEKTYPPLKKIRNKEIDFITTGIWTGQSAQGKMCEYGQPLFRLKPVDIGNSFAKANRVQFSPGRNPQEPSMVVVIYNDYPHIFEAEADEAFNSLLEMTISNPNLEIKIEDNTVSLRIWDILLDLDINFKGLKYSESELQTFLKKAEPNHSLGFTLGLEPESGGHMALAATKKEGLEIITLKGYVLAPSN